MELDPVVRGELVSATFRPTVGGRAPWFVGAARVEVNLAGLRFGGLVVEAGAVFRWRGRAGEVRRAAVVAVRRTPTSEDSRRIDWAEAQLPDREPEAVCSICGGRCDPSSVDGTGVCR